MKYPINQHQHYHAHIYFDQDSSDFASSLRDRIATELNMPVGNFHQKFVGPHLRWSFAIEFDSSEFDKLIPWLDAERGELSVLVHALTDDDYKDHTDYAYWLGAEVELNLTRL